MFDRLLAAVDADEPGALAGSKAVQLAERVDAEVEVLHVVDVRPVYSRYGIAALPSDEEIDTKFERGEESLAQVASEADDRGVPCETEIRRGTPHILIVDHANSVNADAVVIGRPRSSRLQSVFGVSTTDRVIRNADCSVIVAR